MEGMKEKTKDEEDVSVFLFLHCCVHCLHR